MKPTLYTIMKQYRLGVGELAQASGVSSLFVHDMKQGRPVDRTDAKKIIASVNALCSTNYTIDDISANLRG